MIRTINTSSLFDTPCPMAGSIFRLIFLMFIVCYPMACGVVVQKKSHPLPGWYPSITELTADIVASLAAGDRHRLAALHITEQEYATYVWPYLPVAQIPQWQNHRDFVWQQHQIRSMRGFDTILKHYAGRTFRISEVSFTGKPERYGNCTVHSGAVITAQDELGQKQRIRLFGSLIEMNGFYKVFSYSID